ncbi:MAG: glycosyltransferase family 25 protein [Gammaproteobacteria bacterium]|nr:glycosyltransferase family 25 protein [Gammaproteobacteria bacterium]
MNYKIFVINLDERPDKFKNAEDQILAQGLSCERISAVRGSNLSEEEITKNYDAKANKKHYMKTMSVGEIGCYMSHRAAWQKIIDDNLDYAIILEDDCKLEADFHLLPSLLTHLKDWDYIKLTGPRGRKKIQDTACITDKFSIAHYNKVPISTPGQVVSLKGAKALLENSQPFFRPVDVDLQQYWEKNIDIIGIEPKLVGTAGFDSDITAMDKSSARTIKTKFWPRVMFRISTTLSNTMATFKRPNIKSYIK